MAAPLTASLAVGNVTAVALAGSATPVTRGVLVKAAHANTGQVYVGLSSAVTANSAAATDGLELSAGESVFVPAYVASDLSTLYALASAASQKLFLFAY